MSVYYHKPHQPIDGDVIYANHINDESSATDTAFYSVEAVLLAHDAALPYWVDRAQEWAEKDYGEEITDHPGSFSALHWATDAETDAGLCAVAEAAAALSASAALTSEGNASTSETNAATSAGESLASATNSANSALAAGQHAYASEQARDQSENARDAADLSETAAALSETNAGVSEVNALASETAAGLSETAAGISETNAGASEVAAEAAEVSAIQYAIGTPSEPAEGSSKYWAGIAEAQALIALGQNTISAGLGIDVVQTGTGPYDFEVKTVGAELKPDHLVSSDGLIDPAVSVDALGNVTFHENVFSAKQIVLSNPEATSTIDGALRLTGDSGAIILDDAGQKRIAWNDGGGNFNIRSGCYFNGGDKYVLAGDGATDIKMSTDGAGGSIITRCAVAGTLADEVVSWGYEFTQTATTLTWNGGTVWTSSNDGAASGLDADLLDGYNSSFDATTYTVALRNSSADIVARLFRSNYGNQTTIAGAMAFRTSTTDNYIRFCSSTAAIKTWLQAANLTGSSLYNWNTKTCYTTGQHQTSDTCYSKGTQMAGYSTTFGFNTARRYLYVYYLSANNYIWWGPNSVQNTTSIGILRVGANNKSVFRADGNNYCDGGWYGGGADYAEYFEWADGNPSGSDRIGLSVVLDGDKIRMALPTDNPSDILGVTSGYPAIVGDASELGWEGKFKTDDFRRRLTKPMKVFKFTKDGTDYEMSEQDLIEREITIPMDAEMTQTTDQVLSPEFDKDAEYIPRSERKEWSAVGLIGKLRIRKGEPVGDRWIKLKDVTAEVEEWLVR